MESFIGSLKESFKGTLTERFKGNLAGDFTGNSYFTGSLAWRVYRMFYRNLYRKSLEILGRIQLIFALSLEKGPLTKSNSNDRKSITPGQKKKKNECEFIPRSRVCDSMPSNGQEWA